MKKRSIIIGFAVGILILFLAVAVIYKNNYIIKNTIDVSSLTREREEVVNLYSKNYIELPDQTLAKHGFAPTGISYSNMNDCYYIGNYGKRKNEDKGIYPSIICFDASFESIKNELYFNDDSTDIQGISCDEKGSIWYTNSDYVINCSVKDGSIMSSFKIEGFQRYKANGICIDPQDGSLWVLCMYKYLLHYKRDGKLIEAFDCNYIGQDHICIDKEGHIFISTGSDYTGNDNYVLRFSKDFSLEKIYRVNDSYAIEGIVVNGSELIVVNDGIYHDAKIKKNYIQIYNLSSEINNHD